jgi:hypothetical protein
MWQMKKKTFGHSSAFLPHIIEGFFLHPSMLHLVELGPGL